MKCYNPHLCVVNPNGGRPIFTGRRWANRADIDFLIEQGQLSKKVRRQLAGQFTREYIPIPCSKCEECRLEQARDRAQRCFHELLTAKTGVFVTLTYDDDHLPKCGVFEPHAKQFVINLRNKLDPLGIKIRTYGCAEYGDQTKRAHYHLLIFGYDFPDKTEWALRGHDHGQGNMSYRSQLLEECWGLGHAELGELTEASASYVARYTQKKAKKNGNEVPDGQNPERSVCVSRRPGLGFDFFERFNKHFYAIDSHITSTGKQVKVSRYYDRLLEKQFPQKFAEIKALRREKSALTSAVNHTTKQKRVHREVHQARIKRLRRTL